MKKRAETGTIASLGLGSNVGDRLGHLHHALDELARQPGIRVLRCSSVYETEAHVLNPADMQEDYLNAACLVETTLSSEELLERCLKIEAARGRVRSPDQRWHARTLDIDLLHYGELSIDTPTIQVPHPRLAERRFVLVPLFEIAPDLRIPPPIDGTVQYLLDHCEDRTSVAPYRENRGEGATE